MPLAPVAYVPQRVSKRSTVTVDGLGVVENQVIDIEQMINIRHLNQPFGRYAPAQIEMKECRQTTAFLVKLC